MGTHGIAAAPAASIGPAKWSEGTWAQELAESFEQHLKRLDQKVPVLQTVLAQEEPQERKERGSVVRAHAIHFPWEPRTSPSERPG